MVTFGHRHNSKVTLSLVTSKNVGLTRKGSKHEIKFSDSHGNVHVRLVDHLLVILDFFKRLNAVDKHN